MAETTPLFSNGLRGLLRSRRGAFALLVLAPTLVVALYQFLVASPQYQSNAEYVIRGMQNDRPAAGGLADLLAGPASDPASREARSIREYLLSPDAIAALRQLGIDLVKVYHRDDVDTLSKLRFAKPRAETLLDFYRRHVSIDINPDSGITQVSVRAFTPREAQAIARTLMGLGEARVNAFNERAISAGLAVATADLARAEQEVREIQGTLTRFRDVTGDIDPARNSEGTQRQLGEIEAELIKERALLGSMRRYLAASSPQVLAAQSRIDALQQATEEIRDRLTGGSNTVARRLAEYEALKLKQDFAAKRYDAARIAVENAKAQLARQRLFLVPVVSANLPEKPAAPRPVRTTLAVFVGLAIAFAIGWLLLAGVREHEAD